MDLIDAAEIVRRAWLDSAEELPSQDVVMATCPFCGKGDRIRLLPAAGKSPEVVTDEYWSARQLLTQSSGSPAICGFCLNVLLVKDGSAQVPGAD